MRKLHLSVLVILMLGLGTLTMLTSNLGEYVGVIQNLADTNSLASFDPHDRITIDGDYDFNQTATNEGWQGNGSETNPFIIEGYSIQSQYTCIYIGYTDYHFIIRNCSLTTSSGTDFQAAVSFWYIPHGTLDSCFVYDKVVGISMHYSSGCSILNNTVYDIKYFGLELGKCTDFTVANNTFIDTGVSIIGYNTAQWYHTFEDNTVNGRSLLYVREQTGGTLDCSLYGQVILADCEDVDVKNGVIFNATMGIVIGASRNCRVYDNDVSGNKYGIIVSVSSGIHVYNNTAHSKNEYGINVNRSSGCIVEQNEITNSTQVGVAQTQSPDNVYHFNRISDSKWVGFLSHEGENVTLTNNTVYDTEDGIAVYEAVGSKVLYNVIHNNTGVGLTVGWASSSCKIYGNELGWNVGGNALDDGSFNQWDDGISLGNWWSDYSGTGTYAITGTAGSVDRFPYMLGEEYVPPIIATTNTTTTSSTTTSTLPTTSNSSSTPPPGNGEPFDLPIDTIILLSALAGVGIIAIVIYVVVVRKP